MRRRPVLRWLLPFLLVACAPVARTIPVVASPAVDVDLDDSSATVRARVWAMDGTLMVSNGDAEADARDCDLSAHATWEHGDTVLAAIGAESSDDGTPGGWIGSVLPLAESTAVAVRSWTIGWAETGIGERDDELIEIALGDLSAQSIYAPGGRLRLVGVIAGRAIVLVSTRDGSHALAAIDAHEGEVARSEPLSVPTEVLDQTHTELGLPWAVPIDASTLALPCREDGTLCRVTFDGARFSVAPIGIGVEEGFELTEAGPVVVSGDECRALDPASVLGPCAPIVDSADGLPVDGALVTGATADLPLTAVRYVVALPPLHDARTPASEEARDPPAPGPGVVVLDAPEGGASTVAFDLLVRGDHFAISYTRVDVSSAGTMRRDLALALPARSVDARAVEIDGHAAYRVRVETTFPIHYSHACWQGMWVVRAWFEGGSEAVANTYAEYGYCD